MKILLHMLIPEISGRCAWVISGIAMLLATFAAPAQDSLFVQRSGAGLLLAGKPFYAIGANCYLLPELAALGNTNRVGVSQRFESIHFIKTWRGSNSPREILEMSRLNAQSTSGIFPCLLNAE
jgi:hypothetical protein